MDAYIKCIYLVHPYTDIYIQIFHLGDTWEMTVVDVETQVFISRCINRNTFYAVSLSTNGV